MQVFKDMLGLASYCVSIKLGSSFHMCNIWCCNPILYYSVNHNVETFNEKNYNPYCALIFITFLLIHADNWICASDDMQKYLL